MLRVGLVLENEKLSRSKNKLPVFSWIKTIHKYYYFTKHLQQLLHIDTNYCIIETENIWACMRGRGACMVIRKVITPTPNWNRLQLHAPGKPVAVILLFGHNLTKHVNTSK